LEPATIEIVLSVLFLINIAFLSCIKVVFTFALNSEHSLKIPRSKIVAKKIGRIFENRSFFTAVISIGKTVSSSIVTIALYRICAELLESAFVPFAVVLVGSILISFLGYALPKAIATISSEKYLVTCYFFYSINLIFAPVAYLMGLLYRSVLNLKKFDEKLAFLTEDEKDRLSGDTEHGEMLDQEEQAMIRNIFEFGETTVREIMVPRIDMTALKIDADFTEVLRTIYEQGHSRIPIYTDSIDTVVGVLYAKDILRWISSMNGEVKTELFDMNAIMKKPYFVPLNKKLDDLMTDMKANQSHLVVVVDEYGGTAGICSLEDILEEIVGEIRDEYDEIEGDDISQLDECTFLVDPHMELDALAGRLNVELNFGESEYNTVGGLFYHEFGDVPDEGTSFEFQGLVMTIAKMDHQRIEEIRISVPKSCSPLVELK